MILGAKLATGADTMVGYRWLPVAVVTGAVVVGAVVVGAVVVGAVVVGATGAAGVGAGVTV